MKNSVKKIALLIATLIMLISFGCSSAFAASCLFGHTAVATPSVEATCTENGSYGGSYCSKCGTVIEKATVVPAKGHTQSEAPSLKPATIDADGEYSYTCVDCNIIMDSGVISKIDPESVTLSAVKFTYNGKDRKPTVTVKDTTGKALVEGQDYDVVYPESMIMPGKYEVTVIFKGNYSGEQKLSFTIVPKATTGIKAKTATVNSITLQWTKTAGATGYEVYKYNSSTKKYAKIDTVTTNSYKVTGLKGNTTYKFKVRAYTEAADGTILYAANSSVFSTKTTYGVTFTGSSAAIYVGETKQLKATTAPANKKLTWKSSDASIAKVSSSGVVTAVKNGTATITASFKYNNKTYKATYKITVKKPSVTLNNTSLTIREGLTNPLTATTAPADLKVTWKSSNTSVATVSSTGVVTAKVEGTANITASITYKGTTYKKTCKVTVQHIYTAAENLIRLKNYIINSGKINEYGRPYIDFKDDSDSYTYDYTITYYQEYDKIGFNLHTMPINGEGIGTIVICDYYLNTNDVYFGTLINYYNYYGKITNQALAEDTIRPFEYIDEYTLYDRWTSNSFSSSIDLSNLLYLETALAMSEWDEMVYDAIGVGLRDIGFTHYKY